MQAFVENSRRPVNGWKSHPADSAYFELWNTCSCYSCTENEIAIEIQLARHMVKSGLGEKWFAYDSIVVLHKQYTGRFHLYRELQAMDFPTPKTPYSLGSIKEENGLSIIWWCNRVVALQWNGLTKLLNIPNKTLNAAKVPVSFCEAWDMKATGIAFDGRCNP